MKININDKELQNIFKKIKAAEQVIIDVQVRLSKLEQKRSVANSRVLTATAEFSKNVESYLSNTEKIIAIDGKTMCGNSWKEKKANHIVSAWSKEDGY